MIKIYPEVNTIDNSSLLGILTYLDTVTSGWFSIMVVLSLYVIVIIGYYKASQDLAQAFAVSGFFVFVVSLFFWIGGWLSVWAFIIGIAVAIIGAMALLLSKS